jgi:hypothetical protein
VCGEAGIRVVDVGQVGGEAQAAGLDVLAQQRLQPGLAVPMTETRTIRPLPSGQPWLVYWFYRD